jgi:hypothetical protein
MQRLINHIFYLLFPNPFLMDIKAVIRIDKYNANLVLKSGQIIQKNIPQGVDSFIEQLENEVWI